MVTASCPDTWRSPVRRSVTSARQLQKFRRASQRWLYISLPAPPQRDHVFFLPLSSSSSTHYHLHPCLSPELRWQSSLTVHQCSTAFAPPLSDITPTSPPNIWRGGSLRWNLGGHRVAGSDVDFENWVFCICIFTELKKSQIKVSVNMFKTETQIQ